jgi:hypothetical protein
MGFAPIPAVTEPLKSLGPPTFVLVHRTLDNPAGAPDHLTSSVSVFFTLPKSVSPVTHLMLSFALEKIKCFVLTKDDASSGWDVFKNKT